MQLASAREEPQALEDCIAPDCRGLNFYEIDHSLQTLHLLYMRDDEREYMIPHFSRLGAIAGDRLDELARVADRHGPTLHVRNHVGRDEDWIEFHPAYREMEQIGYGDLYERTRVKRRASFRSISFV